MLTSHKAGLALVVLAALGQATAAHAMGVTVLPGPPTGGTNGTPFSYSYAVTPFNAAGNSPTSQFTFAFTDPNVTFASITTGQLDTVTRTSPLTSPATFSNTSSTGATLPNGSQETVTFTSPDGPTGTFTAANQDGVSGPVPGPGAAPVPEASTTVSFGLLLALGLGSVVVAARKKRTA